MTEKIRARRCNDPVVAFWAKVEKTDTCWLWTASAFKAGYGAIRSGGRAEYAHRLSWIMHRGPIPDGLFVCHSCDVRRCVNPDHLFLGTQKDNLVDMVAKCRSTKGERHGLAKLTWEKVASIRSHYAQNEKSQSELGKMFGVSRSEIAAIVRNERWTL